MAKKNNIKQEFNNLLKIAVTLPALKDDKTSVVRQNDKNTGKKTR